MLVLYAHRCWKIAKQNSSFRLTFVFHFFFSSMTSWSFACVAASCSRCCSTTANDPGPGPHRPGWAAAATCSAGSRPPSRRRRLDPDPGSCSGSCSWTSSAWTATATCSSTTASNSSRDARRTHGSCSASASPRTRTSDPRGGQTETGYGYSSEETGGDRARSLRGRRAPVPRARARRTPRGGHRVSRACLGR